MAHPSKRLASRCAGLLLALCVSTAPALAHEGHHAAAPSGEASFLSENAIAMDRMMAAMAAQPSGDISRDFVAMMVPHHQGAIDMATALLRHGGNEQLRRLAQEIIVTQQQEIAAMQLAIGAPLPPSAPSPTQAMPAPSASSVR